MGAIKEKLTIQQVVKDEFTAIDCVKYYFPDATNKYCDFILWEKTCYPVDIEEALDQLYELYKNRNEPSDK